MMLNMNQLSLFTSAYNSICLHPVKMTRIGKMFALQIT